ncbi:endonuclease/exonuclease/phosphatase family protein [Algoriphagus namhaensis]
MKKSILIFLTVLLSHWTMAQEFTVMTFNIYHGENPFPKSSDTTKINFPQLINLIIQKQPEVIALQEVDSMTGRSEALFGERIAMMSRLSRETGYRAYFAKAMDYDGGGYGEGLLMKKRLENNTQLLPYPAGGEPRAVAWSKIELKSEDELYFGGTHFCHEYEENRLAQLQALISYADSLDRPAFWAGDLNFDPESAVYDSIPDYWKDAGREAGNEQPTYTGEEGKRIDYIFYDSRYFELVNYQVLEVDFSDHYPVLATLRLINRKPVPEKDSP